MRGVPIHRKEMRQERTDHRPPGPQLSDRHRPRSRLSFRCGSCDPPFLVDCDLDSSAGLVAGLRSFHSIRRLVGPICITRSTSSLPFMLLAASKRLASPSFVRSLPTMLATSTRPAHSAGPNGKSAYHTVTGLKRWSCDDNDLPPTADIKAIHVYDFDNTRMLISVVIQSQSRRHCL